MSDCPSIRWKIALVILGCLIVYLVGNEGVALWDRDEPRNAQASRQMLQSGDWVVPRLMDQVRTAKPIFIYWCQASAMKVFGDNAFAARFPSAIGMTATLILLAIVIYRTIGPQHALWTVFILGTSGLAIGAAKMSITDAVLLFWITAAQLCFYAIWRGRSDGRIAVAMWIAIGMAGLTKGPVVLGVLLMTAIFLAIFDAFDRNRVLAEPSPLPSPGVPGEGGSLQILDYQSAKNSGPGFWRTFFTSLKWLARTRPILGILIVAAIVSPWLIAVEKHAPGFLHSTTSHDVVNRIFEPLEQHFGPPGYYLMTLVATFFPWCLFAVGAIVIAIKHRREPTIRFALAAMTGPWIMLELVQTKLPHYLLPAFPPLAFITADFLLHAIRGFAAKEKSESSMSFTSAAAALSGWPFAVGLTIWCIAVVLVGAAPWLAHGNFSPLPVYAMNSILAVAVIYSLAVWMRFRDGQITAAAWAMGIGMGISVIFFYAFYLPHADFLRLSPRVGQILKNNNVTGEGQVAMLDYMEPSLAFYQGGSIRENSLRVITAEDLAMLPQWLVITDTVWKNSPEVQDKLEIVDKCRGLAYANRGRIMDVMVVKKK